MLRAEQLALIQEANQQLLSIRQMELQFYVQSFDNLATMSALIAGFTLTALASLDVESFTDEPISQALFWIFCAVTMATSLHCVLTATLCNIFGPGLALRGPAGSMVRAVQGMIREKDAIFVSFFLSIFAFLIVTLATCWVIMKTISAAVSTVILIIGCYYWYTYCLRIYNRFRFDMSEIEWKDDQAQAQDHDQQVKVLSTDHTPLRHVSQDTAHKSSDRMKRTASSTNDSVNTESSLPSVATPRSGGGKVYMEGYLTRKSMNRRIPGSDPWQRFYFGSELVYYKRREDYELDPSRSIKNRPLNVLGFAFSFISPEGQVPYEFCIQPENDPDEKLSWRFRCDTLDEKEMWINAFKGSFTCIA